MTLATLAGALAIGTAIGVLSGLFGVGGGFLITPLLNIVLGIPMPIAVGTSAVQILGVSTAGMYRRRGDGMTDYKMALVLSGGNYVGASLGAAVVKWLSGLGSWAWHGEQTPIVDLVILCVFLVLFASLAALIWKDASRSAVETGDRPALFARINLPPYTTFPAINQPRVSLIAISYLGLSLGFMAGLLGVGGGIVLMPALIYLVGMSAHRASATSLAMIWVSGFASTINHAQLGNTDLLLALPLLVGGSVGVQIGISLCAKLGGQQLKRYFVLVIVLAWVLVAIKVIGILA